MITIHSSPYAGRQMPSPTTARNEAGTSNGSNISGAGASIDTLLGRLAENIPGMTADGLKALDANDYTPEKVAGRIADFVASGLAAAAGRGASEERLNEMYQGALKGVEKGFAEAREILDNLKVLEGEIAEQVDRTETLTFEALNALAPGTEKVSTALGIRMGIVERFSNAEDMKLSVVTQDGDEVTIDFSRNQDYSSGFAAASDGQGNSAALFSLSRSEQSEYRFSVKGSLDDGEIDALQNLIKDVSSLADEFFDGDVQKAFEQSTALDFDMSELASMNLDMSYTRSYSSASRYEQMQQLDQPSGRRLGHMVKGLAESFGAPSLGFLNSPGSFVRDLFAGLVEQDNRYITAPETRQAQYGNNVRQLLDAVLPTEQVES